MMKGTMILGNIQKEAQHYDEMNDVIFDLLCELDRVCQLYDVKYFLAYGTLIGAVRDHGLIRWDDDVDIFITNQELQKLIEHRDAFKKCFQLVIPKDYGDNCYFDSVVRLNCLYAKACKDDDASSYYHNLRSFVSLDLFPISPVPCGFRGWIYSAYMCSLYAMANAFRYHNVTEHYSFWMKIADAALRPLGKRIGLQKLRSMIQRGLTRFEGKHYRKMHNNGNDVGAMFRFYEAEDFDGSVPVFIRNHQFSAPKGYDRILRIQYGNYMVPPPLKSRSWKLVDVDYFKMLPRESDEDICSGPK